MKKPAGNKTSSQARPPEHNPINDSKGLRRLTVTAAFICSLIALLLYSSTISHDYTVDDGTVIANNKITTKGIGALPEIFTSSYRAGFWDRNEGLYRPLSVAMFAIEWEIAPENPLPGHLINIILYSLTAFLLMVTLAGIFDGYSLLFPFSVTLLFVVHPIHTEVVANIKSRDEILCLIFVLLSFLGLLKYLNTKRVIFLAGAAISYFLAFLSKESAITILAFFPLLIWYKGEANSKSIIIKTLPFVLAAAVYMFIRFLVLGELKGSPEIQLINNSIVGAESFTARLATAILVMGKYFYLMIIPHPLSFDYSYNQIPVVSFANIKVLIPAALLVAMVYFTIKGLSKKSPLSLGLAFFFITISLVSNFVILIESTMAERFMYMPSIGILVALLFVIMNYLKVVQVQKGYSITALFKTKPAFSVVLLLVLIIYSGVTISRSNDWKDNLTLLSKDVVTCPESARIRYAYGSALLIEKALKEENIQVKKGILSKSITQLEKGVSILPNYAEAWNHLGIAYKEMENYPAAINAFEKARSYKEFKEADFYISSGLAYGNQKLYDKAIADFTKAISIDPKSAEAFNNKGLYLFEKGQPDSALVFFDEAISLKPGFYQAYYNKGNTLAAKGLFEAAIELYKESLKSNPDYVDAWLNMGNSYAALKDYNNALEYFRKVEQAEPRNKKVLINIGITYRILGDENKAAQYFEAAEKIK